MCSTCPPDLGARIQGRTWPASLFGSAASSDPGNAGKPLETTLYQKLNTHNNTTYLFALSYQYALLQVLTPERVIGYFCVSELLLRYMRISIAEMKRKFGQCIGV